MNEFVRNHSYSSMIATVQSKKRVPLWRRPRSRSLLNELGPFENEFTRGKSDWKTACA